MALHEDARRGGVAQQLIAAAIDWLREHGAPRVILWTAAPNDAAQRLFHDLASATRCSR